MRMRDYIIRRLLLLIPVLLGVTLIAFTLSHVIGDPVAAYVTEKTPDWQVQQIRRAHHLDQPIYVQYFYYLADLLRGDWGLSRAANDRPVIDVIGEFFPATLELTIVAIAFSLALGIPFGIISAVRKDKPIDHGTRVFALTGVSMPIFWLGLLLQYIFFYEFKVAGLPWLPSGSRADEFVILEHPLQRVTGLYLVDSLLTGNTWVFFDSLTHLIMPGFCLSYVTLALIMRMMRSSMLEVLRQDYITLARSKGLSERVVIYKHALKNAMIPTVTVTGIAFGGLLAGAVLTETVFSWPGVGRWSTSAILRTDFAAIMGFTILVAVVYVTVNLVVDVLYAALDPRIRYG